MSREEFMSLLALTGISPKLFPIFSKLFPNFLKFLPNFQNDIPKYSPILSKFYIQSPSNAYKRFGFYEVNLGTLKIEYHGLKMQLRSLPLMSK